MRWSDTRFSGSYRCERPERSPVPTGSAVRGDRGLLLFRFSRGSTRNALSCSYVIALVLTFDHRVCHRIWVTRMFIFIDTPAGMHQRVDAAVLGVNVKIHLLGLGSTPPWSACTRPLRLGFRHALDAVYAAQISGGNTPYRLATRNTISL